MCTRRATRSTVAVGPGWCVPWRAATLAGPAHAPWAARRDKIPQMAVPSGGLARPLRGRAGQRAVRGLPGRVGMRPRAVNSPQGTPRRGHASATPWRDAARATGALCVPTCGRPWDPPPGGARALRAGGGRSARPACTCGMPERGPSRPGRPWGARWGRQEAREEGGEGRRAGVAHRVCLVGLYPFTFLQDRREGAPSERAPCGAESARKRRTPRCGAARSARRRRRGA